MNKLNVRLLLAVIGTSMVLAVGVYFVHRYQVRRQAGFYLQRAKVARAEGRIDEAVGLAQRYVALQPTDAEGLAEYGSLLSATGSYESAYRILGAVLVRDGSRDDVRREMVDVAIALGRFTDAIDHIRGLATLNQPPETDLLVDLARCHRALGDYGAAEEAFTRAIEQKCDPVVYEECARMLESQLGRPDDASATIAQVVADHPENYRSYVIRGNWLLQHARNGGPSASAKDGSAWDDAVSAAQLAQDELDVVSLLARAANSEERINVAAQRIQEAIEETPLNEQLYAAAAELELKREDRGSAVDSAVEVLDRGLEQIPQSLELLWIRAGLQLEIGELADVKSASEQLRQGGYPTAPLDYLDARVLASEEKWTDAQELLVGIERDAQTSAELLRQADYWLGVCYWNLGNHDQATTAFRRAISADPLGIPAREGLAAALVSKGDVAAALNEYWQLSSLPAAPVSVVINWARLHILAKLRGDSSEKDWQTVDWRLAQIASSYPDLVDVPILQAELAFRRKDYDEAIQLLSTAVGEHPDEERLQLARIALISHCPDPDWNQVDDLLEEAKEQFGDSSSLRVVALDVLGARGHDDVAERLDALADVPDRWSPDDQARVSAGLARAYLNIGDDETALQYAESVADHKPGDLMVRLFLFDLAYRRKDDSVLQRVLSEIQEIEGEGPLWHYGKAVQLVLRADERSDDAALAEAMRHLNESAARRPFWVRVPWLQGEVLERQGDQTAAIAKYTRAIELGERRPEAIAQATTLLYRQARFVEADAMLRKLQQEDRQSPFSPELNRLESEVSLQLDDADRALKLAKQAVTEEDSPENHLWLAQVLERTEMFDDAERALRDAISRAPSDTSYWLALIQFLGRRENPTLAEDAIDEAQQQIDPQRRAFFNAQCRESLGQSAEALDAYKLANEQAPLDPVVLRSFAAFLLRQQDFDQAEPLLRSLAGDDVAAEAEDQAWARRTLAFEMARRPGRASFEDARALIDVNLQLDPDSPADKRVQALIWAAQPTRQARQSAIQLFERLQNEGGKLSDDDLFLLAQLYISDNNDWQRGNQLFRGLLSRQGDENPRIIATYIQLLLQRGETRDAELWLNQLQKIAPNDRATEELGLQLLFERKQYSRLDSALNETMIAALADPQNRDVDAVGSIAARYEIFARSLRKKDESEWAEKFSQAAETIYQKLADDEPSTAHLLAGYFARQNRVEQAVETLASLVDAGEYSIVGFVTTVRQLLTRASKAQISELQSLTESVVRDKNRPAASLLLLADLLSWQQNADAAEQHYKSVLQQDPRNTQALNNLAMMIALSQNRTSEAMALVNDAIENSGESGSLLDTRGVVHLVAGNVKDALSDFDKAIAERDTPDRHFHRSQALLLLRQTSQAEAAYRRAREIGLARELLHPLERPGLDQLSLQFGSSKPGTTL